jgi:TolB-like protein
VAEGDGEGQTTGAQSATPDVFISYASPDSTVAEAVCEALERAGVTCWIAPRDVTPGASYAGQIIHAIDAARAIVLILSQNAGSSPHVLREVERSASKRHPIVSLRIDQAPLPEDFEYFLNTSHWLDASNGDTARAIPKLVSALRLAIQTPVVTPASTPAAHTVAPSTNAPQKNRTAIVMASLIGLAIAGFAIDRLWVSSRRAAPNSVPTAAIPVPAPAPAAPAISEKSVAVLPFVDMSEKKDQEYFADGTAEEILDLLAKVPGLHVPARTSSFYFKGKSEDIPTIARRLMVAHVLEGSIRKSGNHVRVTVQLVRADNGYHVWSETYDRTLDDIFKVQDEIAGEVVRVLKISLGADELPRGVAAQNSEAHALVLQARFLGHRGGPDDWAKAVGYYQQAVQLDPNSAPAWAGLSKALAHIGLPFGGLQTGRLLQQAREPVLQAAERAIAIDAQLAEGHEALVLVRYYFDWDWAAAEAENEKIRTLDPAHTNALAFAGRFAALRGNLGGALALTEQAAAMDPLNSNVFAILAYCYYPLGRLTEAEANARKAIELSPTMPGVHTLLAQMLLARGNQDAALAEIEKDSDAGFRAYSLARTYAVLGRRAESLAALALVEKNFASNQADNIATVYALLAQPDQAFVWLERAYQRHDPLLVANPPITVDPDLKSLRGDPRYKALLHKMKLPL